MTKLLTRAEVADVLRVSVRSVDRLRKAGELHATLVLGTVRYHPDDIETYIDGLRKWAALRARAHGTATSPNLPHKEGAL